MAGETQLAFEDLPPLAPGPVSVTGSRLRLRPALKEDIPWFYGWRCDLASLPLWTPNRKMVTLEEFGAEFGRWVANSIVMVVIALDSGEPRGFLRAYNLNFAEGWAWLQASFGTNRLSLGGATRVAEALLLFTKYLFECFPVRRLYSEVYQYNGVSMRLHRRFGFLEEGRLREHVWYRDRFWDSFVFALTRERWQEIFERFTFILAVEDEAAEILGAGARD
jgi:RimJ/RimL family protein N-acetyltransferase